MIYGNIWKCGTSQAKNIIDDQRSKTIKLVLNHNSNQHGHVLFREISETLKSKVLWNHTSDQEESTSLHLKILSINKLP